MRRRLATIEAALRTRYADFGATLASEKLREIEGVSVSKETVRQIQIRLGLWRPRRRRAKKIFQVRERRPRFGELIQIDGSPHDWFEGRGPRCTLIVFIDDATGRLTRLQFAPAETTKAYLQALEAHVLAHGLPLAFYSDRHGQRRLRGEGAQRAAQKIRSPNGRAWPNRRGIHLRRDPARSFLVTHRRAGNRLNRSTSGRFGRTSRSRSGLKAMRPSSCTPAPTG